jgi:hypothetical protein
MREQCQNDQVHGEKRVGARKPQLRLASQNSISDDNTTTTARNL